MSLKNIENWKRNSSRVNAFSHARDRGGTFLLYIVPLSSGQWIWSVEIACREVLLDTTTTISTLLAMHSDTYDQALRQSLNAAVHLDASFGALTPLETSVEAE